MTSAPPNAQPPRQHTLPPLRAHRGDDGPVYTRRPEIEKAIYEALTLPREILLSRALIRRRDAPGYVPSEVLIHFLRCTKNENSEQFFERLCAILIERIEALCRSGRSSADARSDNVASERVRQGVVDIFIMLVSKDREDYDSKLDYMEVSFDQYIARRRLDARKSVGRREGRTDPIESPTADGYIDPAVEKALLDAKGADFSENGSLDARIDLAAAIAQLPEKERTVIILKLKDLDIESKEPGVDTISSLLGCDPKTVRTRLKSAHARLRAILEPRDLS